MHRPAPPQPPHIVGLARRGQRGQALLAAVFFSMIILVIGSILAQVGLKGRMQFTHAKQIFIAQQVAEAAVERAAAGVLYAYTHTDPTDIYFPFAATTRPSPGPWETAAPITLDYTDPNYSSGPFLRTASIKVTNLSYSNVLGRSKKPWIFKIVAVGKAPLAMTTAYGYKAAGAGESTGWLTRTVTRYVMVVEDLTFGVLSCGKVGFGAGCSGGGNAVVNGNVGWGQSGCESSATDTHVPPPNKKRAGTCPPEVSASYLLDQSSYLNPDGTINALVVNFPDAGTAQDLGNYETYANARIMATITPAIDATNSDLETPASHTGSPSFYYKASAMNSGQTPASAAFPLYGTPMNSNMAVLRITMPPGSNGIALYRGTTATNGTLIVNAALPGGVTTTPQVVTIRDGGGGFNSGSIAALPAELAPPGLTERVLLAALQAPGADSRFDPWNNSVVAMIRDTVWYSSVAYAAGPPAISSIVPGTGGAIGTQVTVTGSNFGTAQGHFGAVTINGIQASVVTWSNTSISAVVPAGATTGPIVVTDRSGTVSAASASNFQVILPPPPPIVASMTPTSGTTGTIVTLTGSGFGATQGVTNSVYFGLVQAIPSSWNNTTITVPVPSGATNGTVTVSLSGVPAANKPFFTVDSTAPTIITMAPQCGLAGTTTTINGFNFGAAAATSKVTFTSNPTPPTIPVTTTVLATTPGVTWASTGIQVPAPLGLAAGNYNVVVTVNSIASNPYTFYVSGGVPTVGLAAPSSANVGDTITITGTNYSPLHGTNTVTFNGSSAPISAWSTTSITTAVPVGATTGNLIVNSCGNASLGLPFTVTTTASPSPSPGITVAPAPSPAINPPSTNTSKTIADYSPLRNFVRSIPPYLSTTYAINAATGKARAAVPVIVNVGGISVNWNGTGTYNMTLANVADASTAKYWRGWSDGWPSTYGAATSPVYATYNNPAGTGGTVTVNGGPTLMSTALGLGLLVNNLSGNGNITFGANGLGSLVYITDNFNLSGNWTLFGSLFVASRNGQDFIMTGNSTITFDPYYVNLVNTLLPGFFLPQHNLPMLVIRRALQADWGNTAN